MNKYLIYKYLKGEASKQEQDALMKWVSESAENEKFFTQQMNLWVAGTSPDTRAEEKGYDVIMNKIHDKEDHAAAVNKHKFIWYAAAAIIVLLGLNIIQLLFKDEKKPIGNDAKLSQLYSNVTPVNEVYTVKGTKAKIILPDSSVVWLNSDSKISYPNAFNAESRNIQFSGEAYFDVVHNPQRPMIIKTSKGYYYKVLGTKFNLKSYDNDQDVEITLYSGKVQIFDTDKNNNTMLTEMQPNKIMVLKKASVVSTSQVSEPNQNSQWKEGILDFNDTQMSEVIKMLERWHGVNFIVKDPQILNYRFTARFKSESIIQILDYIKMTTFIDYSVEGNTVTLKRR
ncbi:MAG: FecR family protein [Bacteroidales bacterium]|jgi:transmembrane sensor|nr:FecR family protein [Bacteroidales bacterium]MCI1733112.1 FecR family protein [Bacteroidales bacterium]